MKRVIMIWIGMIFLLIDTKIDGLFFYPAFEPFETNAPITVDMIIGHLIGDSVHVDIFSDIIAYILIILACWSIVNERTAALSSGNGNTYRNIVNKNKKPVSAVMLSFLSLLLYVANTAMPFVLNGEKRYSAGFFLYIIYVLAKCLATIEAGFVCCELVERRENHAWNNVVAIFVMLASFAGFIRAMSYFYDLLWTTRIYYVAQVFFTVLYTVMFWQRRNYLDSGTPIQP